MFYDKFWEHETLFQNVNDLVLTYSFCERLSLVDQEVSPGQHLLISQEVELEVTRCFRREYEAEVPRL